MALTYLEGAMDDKEKTIVEKFADAVKGAVDIAATAAIRAMEQPEADPRKVVRTANEQIYIPEATDAAAMPAPLTKASKTPSMSGRITPTYDFPAPDSPMPLPRKKRKAVVKNSKKAIRKTAPKKSKKAAKKKAAKKTSKKPTKKKSKKSKR
jgi:hypothetical protein